MRQIVTDNPTITSRTVADIILAAIRREPDLVFIPATGNTPMGAYARLAKQIRRDAADVSRVRVFQLDEYLGLPPGDSRLLAGWMERSLIEPLGIPSANVVRFDSMAADVAGMCAAYDAALAAAGGAGLTVLGLGPNGHIGFNEPPSGPDLPTREIALTGASIRSNGPYWGGEERVPRRAVTCGMAPLLAAREIVLVVQGESKREILARTLAGPVTPDVPASFLRDAANVTIVVDRAAWGDLPLPESS
ncbi:MAG: 6-phosphogluconolactonase [Thermomicrobiales bacterium]